MRNAKIILAILLTTLPLAGGVKAGGRKGKINITTSALPATHAYQPYSTTLTVNGGLAPYFWSVISGSLPIGISLNSTTGALTGTPTAAGTTVTFGVIDSRGLSSTKSIGITFYSIASFTITPDAVSLLPLATVQITSFIKYTDGLQVDTTYTSIWSSDTASVATVSSGMVTGVAGGTAHITSAYKGYVQSSLITVELQSSALTIIVDYPTGNLHLGWPYCISFSATGGVPPYTFSISGELPPGMVFNSADGGCVHVVVMPSFSNTTNSWVVQVVPPDGWVTPSGSITLMDGEIQLGTCTLVSGQCSLTATLNHGTHWISALYFSDNGYADQTGTITQVI